jgi:TRAP-type C4-dicarboxylate transport system substrate-binding protein
MHLGLRILLLAGATAAVSALAAGAGAREIKLTASSSHPPIVPWVSTIKNLVVPEANKRLEAKGSQHRIAWTEAYAGALYNFNNTLEGIEQGLGDVGWIGTLWEPVKMPLHNVTFYAPFAASDLKLLLDIQEDLEANFKPFEAEWTKHNIKFLGAQVADSYQLMTKKRIDKLEDVRGLKVMAAGAIAAMARNTGLVAVDGGLPVFYNNIQTGVVDGAIIITTGMMPFKLHEVAPFIAKIDFGGCICGALGMNLDTWKKLPKDVQEVFLDLGRDYAKTQTRLVAELEEKSFKMMPQQGATINDWPESERRRWAMTLPDVAGEWVREQEAKGAPAKALLAAFMDSVRKRGGKPLRDWDK